HGTGTSPATSGTGWNPPGTCWRSPTTNSFATRATHGRPHRRSREKPCPWRTCWRCWATPTPRRRPAVSPCGGATGGATRPEALDTFVKHADRADAVRRLGWIAGDHGHREGLRVAAAHHLADLGAAEEVGQLAGLLLEPPEVTWALHIALLDAITALGLPPP